MDGRIEPQSRLEKIAMGAVCTLLALTFAYLALYCLRYTSVIDPENYFGEHILRQSESIWLNLLALACGAALMMLLSRLERHVSLPLATGILLAFVLLAGGAWVCVMQARPRSDAMSLYYAAEALVRGDVSGFLEPGSYFYIYPRQSGYLLFSELMQRLFGPECFVQIGLVNVALLAAAYGAVLLILWDALHDRRAQLCAILLLGLCLQPLLYGTFLYGNLPGLPFALWAVACAARWARGASSWLLALSVGLCVLATLLKLNYMVVAIALGLLIAVRAMSSRRLRALPLALLMLLLPMLSMNAAQGLLEKRTGASFGSGTPQAAWLAMGLQEGSRAAGWNNQYTGTLLEKNNFEAQAASRQATEDVRERLAVFRSNPAYALSFFHSKLVTQWSETTFESVWVNRVAKSEPDRPALAEKLLDDAFTRPLERYMKAYTLLLYAAFAAGLAMRVFTVFRKDGEGAFGLSALALTIFGALIYHMLFEAKSQYLLLYLPMMVPFAALALSRLLRRSPS